MRSNSLGRTSDWQRFSCGGMNYRSTSIPSPDYGARIIEKAPFRADADALVTVHGMAEEWHVFERVLTGIQDRRLLRLDLAWTGRDGFDWAVGDFTVEQRFEQALAVLPARPRVLLAHSFGAMVVLRHLSQCALQEYEAVVLLAPFAMFPDQRLDWEMLRQLSSSYAHFLELAVQARIDRPIDPDIRAGIAEHMRQQIGPEGCLEFLHHFVRLRRIELSSLQVPILIIGGRDDFYCRPESCLRMAAELPRAEVEILDETGHFLMLEQPERVRNRLIRFLATHRLVNSRDAAIESTP